MIGCILFGVINATTAMLVSENPDILGTSTIVSNQLPKISPVGRGSRNILRHKYGKFTKRKLK